MKFQYILSDPFRENQGSTCSQATLSRQTSAAVELEP